MPFPASPHDVAGLRATAAARAIADSEGHAGPPAPRHLEIARLAIAAADAAISPDRPPSVHVDGLEAGEAVGRRIEEIVALLPPHPSREIQVFNYERSDGSTTLFWHAGRLAAVDTVVRDVSNWSVAAVWENPEVLARPAPPDFLEDETTPPMDGR